jgi:hypothetical protein
MVMTHKTDWLFRLAAVESGKPGSFLSAGEIFGVRLVSRSDNRRLQ